MKNYLLEGEGMGIREELSIAQTKNFTRKTEMLLLARGAENKPIMLANVNNVSFT